MSEQIKTVCLDVPKLGGVQDFRIMTNDEVNKMERKGFRSRYVCSTWPDDGFNDASYDVIHLTNRNDPMLDEYVAVSCGDKA